MIYCSQSAFFFKKILQWFFINKNTFYRNKSEHKTGIFKKKKQTNKQIKTAWGTFSFQSYGILVTTHYMCLNKLFKIILNDTKIKTIQINNVIYLLDTYKFIISFCYLDISERTRVYKDGKRSVVCICFHFKNQLISSIVYLFPCNSVF